MEIGSTALGAEGLQGYTLPLSPEGRANVVPRPPWHYVANFLSIDFWADPAATRALLPGGLEGHPDAGRCTAVFCEWQSCTDGRQELLDPVSWQSTEFLVTVNALLDGEEVRTCPYIWVDSDVSMVRGWIQGYPKKLGSVRMTKTFGHDCPADPGLKPGSVFAGTCAARDRRIANATVTLERRTETVPSWEKWPVVTMRHFPTMNAEAHYAPAVHELAHAVEEDTQVSNIWEGSATLEFLYSPTEELVALAPVRIGRGYRFSFSTTLRDVQAIKQL